MMIVTSSLTILGRLRNWQLYPLLGFELAISIPRNLEDLPKRRWKTGRGVQHNLPPLICLRNQQCLSFLPLPRSFLPPKQMNLPRRHLVSNQHQTQLKNFLAFHPLHRLLYPTLLSLVLLLLQYLVLLLLYLVLLLLYLIRLLLCLMHLVLYLVHLLLYLVLLRLYLVLLLLHLILPPLHLPFLPIPYCQFPMLVQ